MVLNWDRQYITGATRATGTVRMAAELPRMVVEQSSWQRTGP